VAAALPLATDPESSVQQKLAQCAHDLLIAPAFQWGKEQALAELRERKGGVRGSGQGGGGRGRGGGGGGQHQGDVGSGGGGQGSERGSERGSGVADSLGVWQICDRIAATGMLIIFTSLKSDHNLNLSLLLKASSNYPIQRSCLS
jgi:hypothetical protein